MFLFFQMFIMKAVFLDIETTGLDSSQHRPIDIAFKIINISTETVEASWHSVIKQPPEIWDARDLSSIQINEFTWEEILQGKEVSQAANEIIDIFTNHTIIRGSAVFICQNPSFDRGFFSHLIQVYRQEKLNWPYHWLDFASMYWVVQSQKYQKDKVPFPDNLIVSKNEIAKTLLLPAEKTPHRAMQGVEHLIQCYEALLGVKFHEN